LHPRLSGGPGENFFRQSHRLNIIADAGLNFN
jgi:hypothetical protein